MLTDAPRRLLPFEAVTILAVAASFTVPSWFFVSFTEQFKFG